MKRETYERALRSAAQVSFLALPFAGACGGPIYEPVPDAATSGGGDGDGSLSTAECEAALKAAYPDGDPNWYGGEPTKRVDTGVPVATLVSCCSELAATAGSSGDGLGLRDTGCCSLNNETHAVENIGVACTPWGPPMPRAMRRREVLS